MKEEWSYGRQWFYFLKGDICERFPFVLAYIKNELFENEIGIAVSFTVVSKRNKIFRNNLNWGKIVYIENYKTLVN